MVQTRNARNLTRATGTTVNYADRSGTSSAALAYRPPIQLPPIPPYAPPHPLRPQTRRVIEELEYAIFTPGASLDGLTLDEACDLIRPFYAITPDLLHRMIDRNREHHRLMSRKSKGLGRVQMRAELLVREIDRRHKAQKELR